jgi:monoamine oxidase
MELVKELNLEFKLQINGETAIVDQRPIGKLGAMKIPPQPEDTYKFSHGTHQLIRAIATHVPLDKISLNCRVKEIKEDNASQVKVVCDTTSFSAKKVVLCMPPNLVNDLEFFPKLKTDLQNTLQKTHTWMGDSIKLCINYDVDFWSDHEFSGSIFSNQQIIQELYQHHNKSGYGLVGFINQKFNNLSVINLKEKAIKQLVGYFGEAANNYKSIHILNWHTEKYTTSKTNQNLVPHQYNGSKTLREPQWNTKLWFGASETALFNPGYMNGAVQRAQELATTLIKLSS